MLFINGCLKRKKRKVKNCRCNDLLKKLCDLIGVSGYESNVIKCLFRELSDGKFGKTYIDNVGNLVIYRKGKNSKKKILVQAHVDEVGFQIISEIKPGQYNLKSLGNIKTWNAYQQRVVSNTGVEAIIYASDAENLKPYNYGNLYIKIINNVADVRTGEVFTFSSELVENDDFVFGKALDNRVSCYCLWRVIKECKNFDDDIYFCFTVQEEIGMRGARVAKTTIMPDICINIDVSAVCERNSIALAKGVGIKVSDSMSVSSEKLVRLAQDIAKCNGIAFQLEVSDCGTSELILTNELDNGCREIGISIPCEHMHSANAIVSKTDINECIRLLSHYLEAL